MFIGLAPETNLEKAFADMVVDAVMDIRAKARKCRFETDAALKVNILINVCALVLKMFDALISIQSLGADEENLLISQQGCALRNIEGSSVLGPCKIQGAQHMILWKKEDFQLPKGKS